MVEVGQRAANPVDDVPDDGQRGMSDRAESDAADVEVGVEEFGVALRDDQLVSVGEIA